MDAIPYDVDTQFGECEGCQYYPIIPQRQRLKACLFGSPYDSRTAYGKMLQQFQRAWQSFCNAATLVLHPNPHVAQNYTMQHIYWHSYSEMLNCLGLPAVSGRPAVRAWAVTPGR